MKHVKKLLYIHWYFLSVIALLLFAAILRFYDYAHRFALASDQAGFAIVSHYALETKQLPLLGPFSSAGPFQTGGEWYWYIMVGSVLFPPSIIAPWIFLTLSSVALVFLMVLIGKALISKKFGLLLGGIAAVSTAQVIQSTNLTNQTPMALFSAFAILSFLRFVQTKKHHYLFFLGLSVGVAASIHLQGVALVPFILFAFVFYKVFSIKGILLCILGFFLAWVPVLIVDVQNNFFTTKNMADYYLFNKNPIPYEALGRRWLTFVTDFIPNA